MDLKYCFRITRTQEETKDEDINRSILYRISAAKTTQDRLHHHRKHRELSCFYHCRRLHEITTITTPGHTVTTIAAHQDVTTHKPAQTLIFDKPAV